MERMMNLPVFAAPPNASEADLANGLTHPRVEVIAHYVLGPKGTNMEQVCQAWNRARGVEDKAHIVLCSTPEESLDCARRMTDPGVMPTFWTCAVYYKLNKLFFENPDTYPFLFCYSFPLDNMQLCVRKELAAAEFSPDWRVASHPSPAPLVRRSITNPVVGTTSNGQAAKLCAAGETEACITTAKAAALHGLVTFHEFGSPIMVFFVGTTQHGLDVLLGR